MVLYIILLTILLFTSVSLAIVTLRLKGQLRQASLNKLNFLKLLKLTQFVVPACKSLYLCIDTQNVFVLGTTYEARTCSHVIKEGAKQEMWSLPEYEDYLTRKVKYQIEASRTFQQELAQLEASSELSATLKELDAELGLKS